MWVPSVCRLVYNRDAPIEEMSFVLWSRRFGSLLLIHRIDTPPKHRWLVPSGSIENHTKLVGTETSVGEAEEKVKKLKRDGDVGFFEAQDNAGEGSQSQCAWQHCLQQRSAGPASPLWSWRCRLKKVQSTWMMLKTKKEGQRNKKDHSRWKRTLTSQLDTNCIKGDKSVKREDSLTRPPVHLVSKERTKESAS